MTPVGRLVRYDDLGRAWSDLATAVVPSGAPAFRRTGQLQDQRAARYRAAGPDARAELAAAWEATSAIGAEVADCWPLDDAATVALKLELADRMQAIAVVERDALATLAAVVERDLPSG